MTCPTGKRRYVSKSQARKASRNNNHRLRCYLCTTCGGWHVAKRED